MDVTSSFREGQDRDTVYRTVEGHDRQNTCKLSFDSVMDVTSSIREGQDRDIVYRTVKGHDRESTCK